MGWVDINEMYPPEGLQVLLEVSGQIYGANYTGIADHDYYIGCWIVPEGKTETEGQWIIYDSSEEGDGHLYFITIHGWMPLPKHFQPKEHFDQEDDLMEHPMFEDDPEWLYKGDCKYEGVMKMDIWVKDMKTGDKWILDQDKNKIVYLEGTQTVFNINDVGRIRFYPCDPDAESEYQQLCLFDFIENGG